MLTSEDKIRYSRLIALPQIDVEGMERLRQGKVLVIGAGALGSLCAMYLAASGIGTLGIAEFDTIDISNLQRQLFYTTEGSGQPKLDAIASRIADLNPTVKVDRYPALITEKNGPQLIGRYDFIIDATDNAATKMMVDRICSGATKPYCIGGVRDGAGQVMSWREGCVRYSDVFAAPECAGLTPCSIGGVLGPAAGVVASVQAAEAIKFISGAGSMLFDHLFIFDLLNLSSSIISLK